jgi:DNA repair exonuclease SbcCD ATPase subunit
MGPSNLYILNSWTESHQHIDPELSPTSLKDNLFSACSLCAPLALSVSGRMSSDGTISTLPQAQDISHELIHATCRENAHLRQKIRDLEKEVQLWQQSLSEKAQETTQLVSDLRHSQKAAMDLQASADNMRSQLRQQAAMMTSVKEQNAATFRVKERELQKCNQVEEQLEVERRRNAQLVEFFEALNLMNREDLGNLIGDEVDFDGVLASCPTIARHVEKMKQENVAKDEVLEEYKGLHQHLYDMLQRLLGYHLRECDDVEESETTTAYVAMISRATPPFSKIQT